MRNNLLPGAEPINISTGEDQPQKQKSAENDKQSNIDYLMMAEPTIQYYSDAFNGQP